MMAKVYITAAICVFLSLAICANGNQQRVACYYASWATNRQVHFYNIEDIPGHLCTHIIYAFAGIDTNTWKMTPKDRHLDLNMDGYRRFTNLKQKWPHLRALLAVGGWTDRVDDFSDMASEKYRRDIFVSSVVDTLRSYNFDGLDLDWEFPGDLERGGNVTDKENFVSLVSELRGAFDAADGSRARSWELTAAIPVSRWTLNRGYEVGRLCQTLTMVHAMAYDLHGPWEGKADDHTPLYPRMHDENPQQNVRDGMRLLESMGCPSSKLMVGTAFYGHSYLLENPNNNQPGARIKPGSGTTLSYTEICLLQRNEHGWTLKYDSEGKVPYMYKGDRWIGYEDPHSIPFKVELARKYYAGVMVWAIDQDDLSNKCGFGPNPMLQSIALTQNAKSSDN